eukprot:6027124-Prymnesium_polylepis.1
MLRRAREGRRAVVRTRGGTDARWCDCEVDVRAVDDREVPPAPLRPTDRPVRSGHTCCICMWASPYDTHLRHNPE